MVSLSKPRPAISGMYWITGSSTEPILPSAIAAPINAELKDFAEEKEVLTSFRDDSR